MSLDKRILWAKLMLSVGVLLLAYFGFALLGAVQHAWGWRLGESVKVQVDDPCTYRAKRGTLSDCTGTWTTSDGKTHTGQIEGKIVDVNDGPGAMRAFGDTAYTRPGTWINAWGLPAPIAGGLGLILLALSFVVRPSKEKRTQARSQSLPQEILALAEARELGSEKARYWMHYSVTYGVMVFEHGFISSWPKADPVVYRWDEVLGVFERATRDRRKVRTEYVVWPGGDEWLTFADSHVEDVAGLGGVLVESVARRLRPKILAMLQRGEAYEFPRWGSAALTEFTAAGVGGEDGVIPWSELAGVDVQNGRIVIRGRQSLVRPWSDTGNAALLVALLRALITDRQKKSATM